MTQQRQSGEEPVMGEDRLHVVFGTGQVGNALAAHLAGLGNAVRAVSRHRPPAVAGIDGAPPMPPTPKPPATRPRARRSYTSA
jgi:phosphoglycerate dehydrogenase-like enzyme